MTTQVPHRKLRREPWKFGKPQNIFATKRGPLKTLLAVHHKGIRVRKKAFQKARTDTMCLPLKIRERAPEPPARQMIPNKAESRKTLARDPFHPDNRDMYCRKQRRYAAKPQEKRRMRCPPPLFVDMSRRWRTSCTIRYGGAVHTHRLISTQASRTL